MPYWEIMGSELGIPFRTATKAQASRGVKPALVADCTSPELACHGSLLA